MATLEKIRKRSVLLLVVIGVALLAFIIGDFFKLGSLFGADNTVVNVDGLKIDAVEYSRALDAAQRSRSVTGNDQEVLKQEVLRGMVWDNLRNEEYDKLGLTLTDEGLNDAVNGDAAMIANFMVMQATGGQLQSAAQFYDQTNNATKYGVQPEQAEQMKMMWMQFEQSLAQKLIDRKFMSMLEGTLVANKIDAKYLFADQQTAYKVEMVSMPYSNLSDGDSRFAVSDEDLQAEWESKKEYFALQEPSRRVTVINVPVTTSPEDEAAAKALVEETVKNLAATSDLSALKGKHGFENSRVTETMASIDAKIKAGTREGFAAYTPALKAFVDSAKVGQVQILSQSPTSYQIAKLFNSEVVADSLTLTMIVMSNKEVADSVINVVKSGASMEDVNKIEGVIAAVDSLPVSLVNPQMPQLGELAQILSSDAMGYKAMFQEKAVGEFFNPDTLNMHDGIYSYYAVTERKAPVKAVEMALISYEHKPSKATIDDLRERLQKYINENNTADKLLENAAAANYNAMSVYIAPSTPCVYMTRPDGSVIMQGNQYGAQTPLTLPDSHKLAVWAKDAQKGAVSHIFNDEEVSYLAVAGVNDIYTGYTPASDPIVRRNLTTKVRNAKKGDAIIEQYKGKATDLAGYSALMNCGVDSVDVNFFRNDYGAELMAKIATATPGKVSELVKGDNGVVVFKLIEVNAPEREATINDIAPLFNASMGGGMFNAESRMRSDGADNIYRLLLGRRNVENTLDNIYREAE